MFRRVVCSTGALALRARPAYMARVSAAAMPSMTFHTSSKDLMPYKMPEEGGKVRLGFIPEEWFTFFYNKTGVTGPYMFGTGLILYLINKEIYVVSHELLHGALIIGLLVYGVKKFGPAYTAYADKTINDQIEQTYDVKNAQVDALQQSIDAEKKEQWRLDGRNMLFDARKENIAMQIETAYRERLHTVAADVKKKMDYHIEVENVKRRVQQEHMVEWIQKNVIQSITPQQEKENIAQCIRDLKTLSARA
ncbi:ATP synthase peripheral stalk subunit b, mitochondrial-like [Saccoglossus kowalevskii]|uniref:ATP synthase subunit b n=1 Tax=Saccoglossus kowalevskii TaxID=10224 RepID=A0ABM0GJA6_SACKO|nr:PREDICTED: ATP synthase F(0) complex subunit B1, mitochondrial-like [Saccoglossus kowalevskii]